MGYLYQASTTVANCNFVTASFWFRPTAAPSGHNGQYIFSNYSVAQSDWQFAIRYSTLAGSSYIAVDAKPIDSSDLNSWSFRKTPAMVVGTWYHFLIAINNVIESEPLYFGAGYCYLNGTRLINDLTGDLRVIPLGGGAFTIGWAGNTLALPQVDVSNYLSSQPSFQMADFQLWAGTFIDPTVAGNFSKFVKISNGKGTPQDPTIAAAAFGLQSILFKGDHSHFPINLGNGGAFTKVGTAADFTPGPSY